MTRLNKPSAKKESSSASDVVRLKVLIFLNNWYAVLDIEGKKGITAIKNQIKQW